MAPHKANDAKDSPREGRSRSNSDAKRGGGAISKDSEAYKKRRERNNIAVRKSRQLSRQKTKLIDDKVKELRDENRQLEDRVQLLHKELSVLKDLFLSSATPDSTSQGQNSNTA
ncbi:CCAAT/enhancer-binding protein gamma-like [Babylonia areolata]|uniref:CCAAT/enhancer-binding protein gamma-like n=1 Tax=Babylonia areolata TaxID=304850 RepID=UPI003FD599A4